MLDLIPFANVSYEPSTIWDPFQELLGTVAHAAATDIRETEKEFLIDTELPGYEKDEISVSMKEGVLTIRAEHKAGAEEPEQNYIRRERGNAVIERRFEVEGVDANGIKAQYVNGILKLTLPKLPENIPEHHQIEIL